MRDCRFRVAIVAVGRNECKELLSVKIRNGKEVVEKKTTTMNRTRLSMGLYCNFLEEGGNRNYTDLNLRVEK